MKVIINLRQYDGPHVNFQNILTLLSLCKIYIVWSQNVHLVMCSSGKCPIWRIFFFYIYVFSLPPVVSRSFTQLYIRLDFTLLPWKLGIDFAILKHQVSIVQLNKVVADVCVVHVMARFFVVEFNSHVEYSLYFI